MSQRLTVEELRALAPAIAPSMLKCDFADLTAEFKALEAASAPVYHWDVMDGHFVPNLSYGAMVIAPCRKLSDAPFEAHLMVSDPAPYVREYLAAGCEVVTIHIEAVPDPRALLDEIRDAGALAGICFNPGTSVEALRPAVGHADVVLTMSVNPGFGGQAFMPEVLPKVVAARELFGPDVVLSIDGGVALDTISACSEAGVELFVAGSSVFGEADYSLAIRELAKAAGQ